MKGVSKLFDNVAIGRNDINGKAIYEGDMVRFDDHENNKSVEGKIKYNEIICAFVIYVDNPGKEFYVLTSTVGNIEVYEEEYEIELQYFKDSGKYYTEGTYKTVKKQMFDIVDEVQRMKSYETLPGVTGGDWIIYIDAGKHPAGYPVLLLKGE
jgi:hypothetical protein